MTDFFCSEIYKNLSSNTKGYWKPCCNAKPVNNMRIDDTKFMDFFVSDEMEKLRQQQGKGELTDFLKHTCAKCISDERNGVISRRQRSNRSSDLTTIDSIKIKHIGNLCNQKCIMCGPKCSSALALEERKHFDYEGEIIISTNPNDIYLEGLKDVLPRVKMLKFVGGEPLINPMTFEFIDWLDDNKFHHLQLKFTTNCSKRFTDKQREKLSRFTRVHMLCSLDAFGDRCEYIRYPMKYEKAIENVLAFRKEYSVRITSCISIVNFGYMKEFINHLKSFAQYPIFNFVNFPANLSPANIPINIKESYDLTDECLSIKKVNPNHELFLDGIRFLKQRDKVRGNCLIDHCPEFEKYYELV